MQLACNHCKALTSNPESGALHFCDKIIKSTDTRGRRDVRSHDFPDVTPGQDTPGELPFKRVAAFKPAAFYANQDAAGSAKGFSVSHASRTGIKGQAAAAAEDGTPIRHLLHLVQQAIVSMEGVARELDYEMERAVGLLALGLAEIMVNHTTETTPDVVLSNLSRALQKGQGQTIRKIRVNPVDMKPAAANGDSLSGLVGPMQDLPLKGDAALFRGGCVIETDYGTIDATPGNQLRVLLDAFRSIIGSSRSG